MSMCEVDELMIQALRNSVFPGGILLVGSPEIEWCRAYGVANLLTGRPVTENTVFDLASLTKPLATTLAVMLLVQEGLIFLEQEIGSIFSRIPDPRKESILIRQLLLHTSGFPAWRPYFETLRDLPENEREKRREALLFGEPLENSPGKKIVYSDLGFMLLKMIVEKISGKTLDEYVSTRIYSRLGVHLFFPKTGLDHGVEYAATENCPWRKKILQGEVHDDNAFVMGGVDGHSGLFGRAKDVAGLLTALLSGYHGKTPADLFSTGIIRMFLEKDPFAGRTMGFDAPLSSGSSAGTCFGSKTVGHLGFTGTSFWMDLRARIMVILLTNRVHPDRKNFKIRMFRPFLHDAVMKELKGG